MKLISILNAKSIWLFPTNDLNPKGVAHPALLDAVKARYQFQVVPTPAQIVEFTTNNTALQFNMGTFKSTQGLVAVSATYYADGILAATRAGTDATDEFLSDLLTWMSETYGTRSLQQLKIRKVYASDVHISLDNNLSLLNPVLHKFASAYASRAKWPNPADRFEVTGLSFGPDPVSKSQHPPFRIERDVQAPFEDERYFSAAPLQTADHLQMLEELEKSLQA